MDALWQAVAAAVAARFDGRTGGLRDVTVLLPYAALLDPLRKAFAGRGGWQPRVETPLTLAATLAPPPEPLPGPPSGDAVFDRVQALGLLQRRFAGAEPAQQRMAAAVAEAARALCDAAACRPPAQREAFFEQARQAVPAAGGPAALESALLRIALEWAATSPGEPTDALFALAPAAWVVVRIGGSDPLAEALLRAGGGLLVDLDPPEERPFDAVAAQAADGRLRLLRCHDFEAEAVAAAQAVLQALDRGPGSVALAAVDRALVRRIVALLHRAAVVIDDETGWRLSTTAAAAGVLARLNAAAADADADAVLDFLKSAAADSVAVDALEAAWRRQGHAGTAELLGAAAALWQQTQAVLGEWRHPPRRTLAEWIDLLARQLRDGGGHEALLAEPGGAEVITALRLADAEPGWRELASGIPLDLAGFTAWVEAAFDVHTAQPPARPDARVVLTPLARALGRGFAHLVLPGADSQHLGAVEPAAALIGQRLAQQLGVPDAAALRARQRAALAQLLRLPGLTITWRDHEDGELLSASPDLEGLLAAANRLQQPIAVDTWSPPWRELQSTPVARPLPSAVQGLPERLSASALERLRQCPYRFFVRSVLRLEEFDELDLPARKRDYGTWLHAVLHRFHSRHAAGEGAADADALREAGRQAQAELGLDDARLLPFLASFEGFIPAYLAWLDARTAEGWQWQSGEREMKSAPQAWAPQRLEGRVDRIDRGPGGVLQVIDYKTGSLAGLRERVKRPLEDTQLAFYAALLMQQPEAEGAGLSAAYLALDDAKAPLAVVHDEVAATAAEFVKQLGSELQRLREGAPLPALGEGSTCDHCEARGLCRRDHWAAPDEGGR